MISAVVSSRTSSQVASQDLLVPRELHCTPTHNKRAANIVSQAPRSITVNLSLSFSVLSFSLQLKRLSFTGRKESMTTSFHKVPPLGSSTPNNKHEEVEGEEVKDYTTTSNNPLAPLILSSGYLTKRSSSRLRTKWLRRWWQLLGDGTLIYFKGDERVRVLGEIDIAHTCYDVRLGAEHCSVSFPPVIPSNCCLSFSVLKRTYYAFAPTPAEATKWANVLHLSSYLLNRSRPRELSVSPAVLVATEELEITPPLPPTAPPPPSSHKPPPPPPPVSSSMEESEDEPKQLPTFQSLGRGTHLSVPDLRFDYGSAAKSAAGGQAQARSSYGYHNNSYLATANSSQQSQSSTSTPSQPSYSQPSPSQALRHQTSGGGASRRQNRSQSFLLSSSSGAGHASASVGGASPHASHDVSKRRHTLKEIQSNYHKKKTSKEGERDKKSLQKRSSLRNWYTSHGDLLNYGNNSTSSLTLPTPGKLTRSKWKSEYDTTAIDSTHQRLEELHKQEEEIKKRLRELKKTERQSFAGPIHGIPVLPLSPTENISTPTYNFFPETTPTHHSQFDPQEEPDSSKSGVVKRVPKKPPKKAPKPSIKRTQTPYRSLNVEDLQDENRLPVDSTTSPPPPPVTYSDDSKKKSSAIRSYEANIWVKRELKKVFIIYNANNSITV